MVEGKLRWVVLWFLLAWPALAQTVPGALAKRIAADPEGYVAEMEALIAGYGVNGAVDRPALDNAVALARASARATPLRRLQGADLDGDGGVSVAELAVTMAAASAAQRGRLAGYVARADRDGDGAVSPAELAAYAGAAALDAYDEARAARLRAVLGFDADGDGRVTLDEVRAGVAALARPAVHRPGSAA